ncbi:aspartate kinase [Coniophora puteana RWD-64-598 SS2]|uniref:aspartate kinase n=1 Tax=Coniophora puteana (strain RWD-64-598) TaxID=741705 RepID=R7SDU3_CONPW|nr:aspartate kinase [Coniophora puteana RWD-64-598 SS2]EIW74336.1 aspartate kinase [Coniophora puteana RWD-64-598 SS2]
MAAIIEPIQEASSPLTVSSTLDGVSLDALPVLRPNCPKGDAPWIIQKFGGTSVGKFAVEIARDVVSTHCTTNKIAIVCSARSGSTKALGTTNLLLRAASEAIQRPSKTSLGSATPVTSGIFGRIPVSTPGTPGANTPRARSHSSPRSSSPLFGLTPASPPQGESEGSFNVTVDLIKSEHFTAARAVIKNEAILEELEAEVERDCEWLRNFLSAAQIVDEISPRSRDSIIGLGEKLGCKVMTAVLRDQGIDAEYVSLEDVVPASDDINSGEGSLGQAFYDGVAEAVGARILQCGSRVAVVTGFFGPVPGSLLRQVGRGYTDLLSALLAVGVRASELQIWKEVDGIFTADPRKVVTARLIPVISPEEAAELTYYGSEVVHPFTMEQVTRRKIPIRIKNVNNPLGGGTLIHPDPEKQAAARPPMSDTPGRTGGRPGFSEPISASSLTLEGLGIASDAAHRQKRLPTAVTIKERIVVLNVNSNRKSVSHGFLARIFGTLDRYGVVVDLISTSEVHVSMAIEDGLGGRVIDRLVTDLHQLGTVSMVRDMAILSLVGKQMRNMIGISGRMFTTLAQGNVNIEMISQGASEINISCVIKGSDAVKALNLIHQSCLQIKPEGEKGRVGPWFF